MNTSQKQRVCIILVSLFFVLSAAGVHGTAHQLGSTVLDFDPLVDVIVTVEIHKMRAFDKYDQQLRFREYVDRWSDPDFYLKVFINGEEFTSPTWHNTKYIYDPNWSATLDVPDDEEYVDIIIQLWDHGDEGLGTDKLCDISGDGGFTDDRYDVELVYSIKTGHWTGDDAQDEDPAPNYPSGYGRLNGCDDGSIYRHDRDCELWFAISQNDSDYDGIPYWIEVNEYGTDPEVNDTGYDNDSDGVPIEWEWKWGYDPFTWENHRELDPDSDGLNNTEEYRMAQWDSDPFRKDLFLELDQMEEGPLGEQCLLPPGSKELLYTAYNRQNVVYHLDDGSWADSGSDMIPFDDLTDADWNVEANELNEIYNDYFLHGDETNWRRGVFHYGVVIYQSSEVNGNAFGPNRFQISAKGMEEKAEIPWLDREVVYASAYMHETGHTLNFFPIPGHNQRSYYPWQIGWWLSRPYKSCMNYGYMYSTVDYSDGSRLIRDYDDWNRMDLTYFETDWQY